MAKYRSIAIVALAVLCTAASPAPQPIPSPAAQIDITKVTCGDVTAASPLDRAAIVMFYWGYAAAKAGATTFKTGVLRNATRALIDECNGKSSETVLDAMSRINVKAF